MDEMRIKLSSSITRTIISKLITKYIRKSLGIKPVIKVNEITVNTVNNKMHIHVDVDSIIDEGSYLKVLQKIDTE